MSERIKIAPSILSADFANLEAALKDVDAAGADWIHLDVMDGHFVPNLTFGPPVIKALRPHTKRPFDVHLMVTNPEDLLADYADAGADHITFHVELGIDTQELLQKIRSKNIKAGLSLKPDTPANVLRAFLPFLDIVLVMTVEPGFGGQEYMPEMEEKIREIKTMANEQNHPITIVVDGGINPETAPGAIKAGADCLVAGSAVFKHGEGLEAAINALRGANKS